MNKKLGKEDKEFLRSRYRSKVWELGYYLLAHEVRGEDFEYIMQGGEEVNCNSKKQRQQWLAEAMDRMVERLPEELVKEIREGSACCLGGKRHELAKEIHDSYDTVEERFQELAKTQYIIGDTAKKVGDNTYRVCFWENPPEKGSCSCLKYVPKKEPMSKDWCLCCGGHIKKHFETALGVKAECTCISSQLSSCGKEPCVFELRVIEEK